MRRVAGPAAIGGLLATFDAFADSMGQAILTWLLLVVAGFFACIVVELAAGQGVWWQRLAIGTGFAVLDGFAYLIYLNIDIERSIGGPPATGLGSVIVLTLVAWIIPALRLAWLLWRRSRKPA